MPVEERICPVRRLTSEPQAHFFGDSDQSPWDASGRYALALQTEPSNRMPLPGEKATILLIDCEKGAAKPLADTTAWNWQHGCRLQWFPPGGDREIIFNDIQDNQYVTVILNIATGARRVLPRPIYTVSRDGKFAISISLARLAHLRPVMDYAGVPDPFVAALAPKEDGIWRLDLMTGESRLLVSLAQAAQLEPRDSMDYVKHRFEDVSLNPAGTRFYFLHRWPRLVGGRPHFDRLLTCNPDGSNLYILADDDCVVYYDWRDDNHVLAWAREEKGGERFYLLTDQDTAMQTVGEGVLTEPGHCRYSPDRRWIVTDTNPDHLTRRQVILYEVATGNCFDVGAFVTPPPFLRGDLRCDLNPRWSRDGRAVEIDSSHEGTRQMYLIDVAEIVKQSTAS